MTRFFQVTLRTSNVEAARAFYAAVLGNGPRNIVQLHEQAVARGAFPHWLGFLEVADVDRAMAAFAGRGASPLSPKWTNPEGLEGMTLRDPGGAVVALGKPPELAREAASAIGSAPYVVWYQLNTPEVELAKANYRELFGWEFKEPLDLGAHGVFHPFAWEHEGAPVGSMSDLASRSGVHPHWLFYFRVVALEPAMNAVRTAGGMVVDSVMPPTGARIAICNDPQGAAFAMREGTRG